MGELLDISQLTSGDGLDQIGGGMGFGIPHDRDSPTVGEDGLSLGYCLLCIVSPLGMNIGLESAKETVDGMFGKQGDVVDACQGIEDLDTLILRHDGTACPFELLHGFVAVDSNNQNVSLSFGLS